MSFSALLPHRSVIRIGGADRRAFLQNLVSNDVDKATEANAVYAALLTPQGKFLHDLFIIEREDGLLVDCERERADHLLNALIHYKLRSKVTFDNLSDIYDVWASLETIPSDAIAFADPRLPEMGMRFFIAKDKSPPHSTGDFALYDQHRLTLGIADGSRDMQIEKSSLADGNFDLLNGIDWKKGCYTGQELTARMHYRGLTKKRLFPVRIEGEAPSNGTILGDSNEMRSSCGSLGLALLKIDEV